MATLPKDPSKTAKSATKAAVAKPKVAQVPAADAALPAQAAPIATPEPESAPAPAPNPAPNPALAPATATASASATTKSAVYKINARRKAIQEVLFKDSDLVLLLEDGRSLLVKDGALQYALQQSFILQFDEERVLSTEFIQNHPKVNYSLGNLDDNLLFSSGVILPTYDGDLLDLTINSELPGDVPPPPSAPLAVPTPAATPSVEPFINKYLGLGALAAGLLLAAKGASSQSGSDGTATALVAPANTLPPLLSLGRGVADGATAAEATDSAGVVILNASSGNTVVVTFVDSSANTLTKTLTGTGHDQPVVLVASDIGSGPGQLHDGVITVSALASGSGGVRSSNGTTSFTLDTTAAILKDLALTANVGDGSTLKAGDVLTLTATYDSVVIGNPTPPTLSIGSKTDIALTPKDTSGSVRSWTYTISNNGTPDNGAIALAGGDYLQGVTDSAGNPSTNPAAGAPQLKPISFHVDSSTPARPTLSLGLGVDNGATAAEALASSGVLSLTAESGTRVEVSFTDGTRSFTKTLAATGNSQPVVLGADEVAQLQDGTIHVSAIATNAAQIASSPGITSFNLDTQAPVFNRITLLSSNAASNSNPATPLKPGDVLTLTAEYSEDITGSPTPTLQIGSETGVAMTPLTTSGKTRVWTYTISQTDSVNNPADQGAITVEGLGSTFLLHVHDRAGNPASNASPAPTQGVTFSADTTTPAAPTAPTLVWGSGVSGGATAAEATQSSGVLWLHAESGNTVVLTFSDSASPANTVSKTVTADGSTAQAVTLAASDIGNSGNALHDGTINVSAVATNAAHVSSSATPSSFNLDTTAPVLNSLALTGSSGNNALKLGDVLTYTASYDGEVLGTPTAPTLTIGSETGIDMTAGITTGNTRTWTYTISKTGTSDSGAVSVVGGNYLTGIADAAGNAATGAPTSNNGTFSADTTTPTAPKLVWGSGVSGGATAAEATQSSGVLWLHAESGNTVVLTFSDSASPANTVSKTVTADGSTAQAVTLAASDIGNSGSLLHDGTINVSAVATNAAHVSSSATPSSFNLDTKAPVLNSLALTSSSGNNALKLGDVLTYTATYDGEVFGTPTAPTLTIGSETGITMTAGITSGNTRTWTYTISKTGTSDSGAVSVVGGNYLTGITDAAGNAATGSPASANGTFSADANTPSAPTLTWGSGVSGGATAAEATQSSGVLWLHAESGNTVVLTFSDSASPANTVSKTVTADGSTAQAVTLAASDIGNSGSLLHDGTINVSAVATNAAHVSSSATPSSFNLDTTAPVLNSLALTSNTGSSSLKLGDVLTYTATYDGPVEGSISAANAPTLTIGSEPGITMTAGITTGNTRTWTYTISKTGTSDSGAVSVVQGDYKTGITDAAGNTATGAPTPNNGTFSADANTPSAPTLTWGSGVSGGATAAEATQSSGVLWLHAESGNTVVLTFSDSASPANTVSKTVTADGSTAQAVTLAASDIGNSGSLLHDGTINVSAVATNAAHVSSSATPSSFNLDTTAPVLNSLALTGSSGNNALKLGDVLTYTATYDGEVFGTPTAPTLTIGSESTIDMTPGITTGSTRTWTYTISKTGTSDSGAVSVVQGDYKTGITDAAGNAATGSPTSANGTFSADANTPTAPTLTLGAGVLGGATAAEATQSGGVVLVAGESGTTVVLTFTDKDGHTVTSSPVTITATGSSFPVTLASADVGSNGSGGTLGDGTITVSAVATNSANVSSSNSVKAFTLDTTAPVLNSLALTGSSGNNALKLGDVLTYTASYDGEVFGTPTAPTLTIGSESTIDMTPGIASGNTRTWTYTIRKSTGGTDLDDSGAVSVVGGNYLTGIADVAGNAATGAPTSNNGTFSADTTTPTAPKLVWGSGVSGGATAAEATQSSGVLWLHAESGNTVVLTFSDSASPANTVSKTVTADGSTAQAVTLAASDIGNSGSLLHDGTINVSAVATNAAHVSSSATPSSFNLDTRAPVLNSLALTGNTGSSSLKLGDVLTYTATYDGPVDGSISAANAPTLTIGSETGITMTAGIASGNTRTWTYTIRKSTGGTDLDDSGAVSVVGGNYLTGIADVAGNAATGSPTPSNGTFSADSTTPTAPKLVWGSGVSGGATAAEATQSSGVLWLHAESGNTVVLTFSDSASPANTVSKTVTADGSTAQAVTLAASDIGNSGSMLHDGTINVSAVASNAAHVSSSATASSFYLDTIKPNAPSLPLPAYASGGVSRAEALSSAGVLALTAESGSTVLVTFSDSNNHLVQKTLIGTGSAQPLVLLDADLGTGNSGLDEGTIAVTAIATDAAGNRSLVGSSSFTLDTIAPTLPTLTGLAFSQDTAANGATNSDFITTVQSQSITATLAASLANGETLRGSVDGGTTWVNLTGLLTSGTQLNWAVNLLAGKNQLLFKVSDAAGNDSAITTQAYELDQSAPTQLATTLALSADTAAAEDSSTNTDFITRTAAQTISASLSAALGSDEGLWGSLDGGANWVNVTPFVSGTSLSWTGASLLAGTNTLLLKVSDKAGNDGSVRSQAYAVDTTAPTSAIATVGFTNDTGRSSSDLITSQASQIIQGSLNSTVQAGETVYVSVNGGGVWFPASSTVGSSSYSLAGATLLDGSNVLLIKVCDVAGNSGPVVTRSYTLDTSPPNPPALQLGSGVADGTTADEATASTGVITLTAESGASVVVTFSDGLAAHDIVKTLLATGSAQSVTLDASEIGNGKLQDGPITVTATATDSAGNVGTNSTSFTLDTQPDTPMLALGTGVSDGATLLEATQASGVATFSTKSGSTVQVTFSDSHSDGTPAHNHTFTMTATGSAQPLTLDASHIGTGSNQLHEGTITVTVSTTDSAGNTSPEVSTTFTLDTIAPANPVQAVIPSVATGGASLAEATDSAGVLTVNAELLATVRLTFSNGTQSLTKVLTGTGNPLAVTLNSADLGTGSNQLQDGTITVTATATDVAGNPSTNTANTATFTLDTRAPEAPLIVLGADVQAGATQADAVQSSGVVLISAEAGSVVNVTFSNGTQSVIRQFTATGSAQAVTLDASDIGTGSNQLQDGTIRVSVSATDAAGNSTSNTSSFVLDTRYDTTQLLSLGSGVAGFTVISEATQTSGVVTLHAESGSSVWVTFTDANNTSIVKTLVGSGVPGQAVTLSANDYGSFANQLHDGNIKVTATGIDRAGNVNTAFTSFVLDTQAPAQANVVFRKTPVGVFSRAGITSPLGLFQFHTEPGASVRAEFTSTDTVNGITTVYRTYAYNDSLATNAPWQAATLADSDIGTGANQLRPGTVSVTWVTVDAAGNESAASASTTFTLDTYTRPTPVLTLAAASSDGRISKAEASNSPVVFTMPTDSGTLFTYIFTDSYGNSKTGEDSCYISTTQDVTLASSDIGNAMGQLHDGLITVSAVVSSLAGSDIGTSAPGSTSFVLDTTAPKLVAVTKLSSTQIKLFFTEPIDSSALTLAAARSFFKLKDSSDNTLTPTPAGYYSAVSVEDSTVTLTLNSGFSPDNTKIGYEPPTPAGDQTTGVVQDRAGNDMAQSSFSWATDAQKAYSSPNANSMIVGFTVTDAHGSPSRGKAGDVVSVDVRFSNNITLSANTSYSVTVDIDGSNSFSALLTTGASTQTADHFAFTATLPNTSGITSNALSIRDSSVGLSVSKLNLKKTLSPSHVVSTDYLVDTIAPTVDIARADDQTWISTVPAGHSALIQFTFSENPGSSFTLNSLTASTDGTFSNLTGSGRVRYATFTPAPNTNNGSAAIGVAADSYSDAAGNAGVASVSTFNLRFDTAPPTPPILSQGAGIEDGATAAEAAQASGVFTMQAESGQAVVLTFTDSAATAHSVTRTVTGAGMGSAVAVVLAATDITALADGAVTVLAVATDAAGNSSRSNSGFTLNAAVPAASGFVFASGGTENASKITVNSPIVNISGTAVGSAGSAGSNMGVTWQYSLDSGSNWTVGTGSSFQVESNASYAPNAIQVKMTDSAGNTSSSQLAKTLAVDTVAPVAPSIAFASGLGLKTAAGAGVVSIQAESGSKVVVNFSDGSHSVTKTVTGMGHNTSAPITLAASDLGTGNALLLDGSITVTAVATDSVGNASAASTSSFALNSSAPALFVKSGQDRFVNRTETGVDIEVYSAALHANDVLVFRIDGATFAGNSKTVTATEATAGRVSFAISTSLLGNTDGIKNISATLTPAAGGAAVNSSTLALTLDTAAPAAPSLALGNAVIHGATLADATSSSGVVLVSAESGVSVAVTFSDGTRSIVKTITGQGSNNAVRVTLSSTDIGSLGSQLHEGRISVSAVATNAAGNTSAAGSSSFVLDTSTPNAPGLALGDGVSSGGASRGEALDSLITFTAESGSTAWLSFSDGVRTLNKTLAVNSTATQTVAMLASELGTGTSQLHDGVINVSAVVLDAAGNVSGVANTRFVLDSTVPDAPVILLNAGVANYGASRAKAIGSEGVLTVTAESGTTVTVAFTDTNGHVVRKNIRALGSQNAVRVALEITDFGYNSDQIGNGTITVTAETMDQAGNISAESTGVSFTLSTIAPPAPTLQLGTGVSDVANRAEATQPDGVVTVNSVSGMQVVVTFSDGVRSVVKTVSVVSTANAVTLDATDLGTASSQQLRDGTITVWAVTVDQAGNVSPSSASRTFTMDATPPAPPEVLTGIGIVPGGATRYEALDPNGVVNVRAEPGSIIRVTFSDGLPQHNVIKTFTGTGSAQTVVLLEQDIAATPGSGQVAGKLNTGVIIVTAVATDAAGNTSEQGRTAFAFDTVAPNLLISSDRSILKVGETATITFAFNELPDTFSLDMVQVSGGTLSNLNNVNTPTRTATFTPDPNTNSGNASIRIAAGIYKDTAGNIGSASNTFIQRFDTKAPNIVSASLIGQTIVLNFDSDIDPDALTTSAVANSLFTYKKAASGSSNFVAVPNAFTNVVISGSKVTLALSAPLGTGESATVSYTAPNTDQTTNVVQDLVGNDLANFADVGLDTAPIITEFVVSEPVSATTTPFPEALNGPALGKGGEAVIVTVTFSTPVKLLKGKTYRVSIREGSMDSSDTLFSAYFRTGATDVTGTSFDFTGNLRTTEGISTNTFRLTAYQGEAGSITSTISNLPLTQNSYNLFSSAYTVDTLAPTTGISSHQGVSLDASKGQYVALPAVLGAIGGDITLEAWIYADGPQQNGATILNLGSAGSNNISLNLNQGKIVFEAFDSSHSSLGKAISFQPLAQNSWSHLAVTVSDTNVLTLYVNGLPAPFSLDGATAATSATLSGTIPDVARRFNSLGTATPATAFNGTIGDLRVYNYARSTVQIQSDQLGAVDPSDYRLMGYYPFGGRQGLALNPGNGQYVDLPPLRETLGGDITLETWVYANGQQNADTTVLNLGSASGNNITLSMTNVAYSVLTGVADGLLLGFEAFNGATSLGKAITISDKPLALNTWNHVAVRVSAARELTLYVNGEPVAFSLNNATFNTKATLAVAIPEATRTISLGSATAANQFNGTISDLRIYSNARSAAQIQIDWLIPVDPNDSNLVGHYPFNTTPNSGLTNGLSAIIHGGAVYSSIALLSLSADTGSSPKDLNTKTARQTVTGTLLGTLDDGDRVYGSMDEGKTWLNTNISTSGSTVTWANVTLQQPLASGQPRTIRFLVRDAAGNDGPIVTQTYVLDTMPPVPTLTLGSGVTSGASWAEATQTSGVLTINADSGSTVVVTFSDGSRTVDKTIIATATTARQPIQLDATDLGTGTNQLQDGTITATANVTDLAGNTTLVTATASFTLDTMPPQAGVTKHALGLNASSKQYMVLSPPASDIGDDITIETLFYAKSDSGTIFDFGDTNQSNKLTLEIDSLGRLAFTVYERNTATPGAAFRSKSILSSTTVTLNEWHHVAVQIDKTAVTSPSASTTLVLRLFLDGVQNATSTESNLNTSATGNNDFDVIAPRSNYYLGRKIDVPSASPPITPNYFNGSLADFRVYNNIRSAADIAADMQGNVDATDTNLKLYYPLNGNASSGITGGIAATPSSDATPSASNLPGYQIMASFTNDTGPSATDFVTNATNLDIVAIINPRPAADETLYGSIDGGATWQVLTLNPLSQVKWNKTFLPNTSNTLVLQVRDAAGNIVPIYSKAYTIDTIAPAAPTVALGAGITTSTSNGVSTTEATQASGVVTVSAEAQATASVTFIDSATPPNRIIKTVITNGIGSSVPVTLNANDIGNGTGQLHDGLITVTATTTDLAGNLSTGASGSTSFTLDTVAIATYSRQALTLDAWKNQSASLAGIAGTSYGASMTLEAWIKPDLGQIPDGKYMPIFDLNSGENAANNNIFLGITKQGNLYFSAYSGATRLGNATVNSNTELITSNVWQHVAVTVDNIGIIKLYLNGNLISNILGGYIIVNGAGNTINTIPSIARSIANIGKSTNPSESFSNSATDRNNYYNGSISDVRIYTEARDAASILSDSGGTVNSNAANLIAYYPFVNGAGSGKSGGTDASLSNIANSAYPVAYSLAFSDDTAVLGTENHDFITKATTQTIYGTLTEPWVSNNKIFIDGLSNNKSTAVGDGGYTLYVPPNSNTFNIIGAKLKTGTNDLKIWVVDAAGNIGPTLTQIYTLDTVAPTTALKAGVMLNSTYLSNSGQYVSLPAAAGAVGGNVTLEAWVYYVPDTSGSNKAIIKLGGSNNTDLIYLYITPGNRLGFKTYSGSPPNAEVLSDVLLTPNAWSHVAVTVDSGDTRDEPNDPTSPFVTKVRMYVNGDSVQVRTNDSIPLIGPTLPLNSSLNNTPRANNFVGRIDTNGIQTYQSDFNGAISDVRIYDNDRTAQQISGDMSGNIDTGDSNLKAYYPLYGNAKSGLPIGADATFVNAPGFQIRTGMLALSTDTGPTGDNSDFITNTAYQTITGTVSAALVSGETVWVSVDRGINWNQATSSIGSVAWSIAATLLPPPAIESNAIMVKVSDAAGNDGPIGSKSYRLDTTAPTLDLNGSLAAGNDTTTNITSANAGSFNANSAILPSVALITATDVAKITLDFAETGNVLKANDRLKVGTVVADLDLNAASSSITGTGILGSLTGLDYTYDIAKHTLSLFKHDGSAMDAAIIATALGNLQFKNSTSPGGTRDFVVHLIDLAGNDAFANGQIVI